MVANLLYSFTISQVWAKAEPVAEFDPAMIRQDRCGAFIARQAYGNVNHALGWEIDHIKPECLGGGDELSNLQPLHWSNNRSKGDSYPFWNCRLPRTKLMMS